VHFVCLFVCMFVCPNTVNGVRSEAAVESRNNQAGFDRLTHGRARGQTACWVAFNLGQKEIRRVKFEIGPTSACFCAFHLLRS
jgi:hypothetical protein